jgi:AcrR family transcriptional regulator
MPRTGGDKRRKKILKAAEELFSQNGFNGTSVNQIAEKADVNKALIYYYFKDKNDIVISLFQHILEELSELESEPPEPTTGSARTSSDNREALKKEIAFLDKKKRIISVLLMESLKTHDKDTSLFRCTELVMAHEHGPPKTKSEIVHEFFTGVIPLIAFVVLRDKFCNFFQCSRSEALNHFVESFLKSHVSTHFEDEAEHDSKDSR